MEPESRYQGRLVVAVQAFYRQALLTIEAKGISCLPNFDLRGPRLFHPSARCRTRIAPGSRSTPSQGSPSTHWHAFPVKIAVMRSGRQRPVAFSVDYFARSFHRRPFEEIENRAPSGLRLCDTIPIHESDQTPPFGIVIPANLQSSRPRRSSSSR